MANNTPGFQPRPLGAVEGGRSGRMGTEVNMWHRPDFAPARRLLNRDAKPIAEAPRYNPLDAAKRAQADLAVEKLSAAVSGRIDSDPTTLGQRLDGFMLESLPSGEYRTVANLRQDYTLSDSFKGLTLNISKTSVDNDVSTVKVDIVIDNTFYSGSGTVTMKLKGDFGTATASARKRFIEQTKQNLIHTLFQDYPDKVAVGLKNLEQNLPADKKSSIALEYTDFKLSSKQVDKGLADQIGSHRNPAPGTYNYRALEHNKTTSHDKHLDLMVVGQVKSSPTGQLHEITNLLFPKFSVDLVDTNSGRKQWEKVTISSDGVQVFAEFSASLSGRKIFSWPFRKTADAKLKFIIGTVADDQDKLMQRAEHFFKNMSENVLDRRYSVKVLESNLIRDLLKPSGLGQGIKLVEAKNISFSQVAWKGIDVSATYFEACQFLDCTLAGDFSGAHFHNCVSKKSHFDMSASNGMLIDGPKSNWKSNTKFAGHFAAHVQNVVFHCDLYAVKDARGANFDYSKDRALLNKTRNMVWDRSVFEVDQKDFLARAKKYLRASKPRDANDKDWVDEINKNSLLNVVKGSERQQLVKQLAPLFAEQNFDESQMTFIQLPEKQVLMVNSLKDEAEQNSQLEIVSLIDSGFGFQETSRHNVPASYIISVLSRVTMSASTDNPLSDSNFDLMEILQQIETKSIKVEENFAPIYELLKKLPKLETYKDQTGLTLKQHIDQLFSQELQHQSIDPEFHKFRQTATPDLFTDPSKQFLLQPYFYAGIATEIMHAVEAPTPTSNKSHWMKAEKIISKLASENPAELARIAIDLALNGRCSLSGNLKELCLPKGYKDELIPGSLPKTGNLRSNKLSPATFLTARMQAAIDNSFAKNTDLTSILDSILPTPPIVIEPENVTKKTPIALIAPTSQDQILSFASPIALIAPTSQDQILYQEADADAEDAAPAPSRLARFRAWVSNVVSRIDSTAQNILRNSYMESSAIIQSFAARPATVHEIADDDTEDGADVNADENEVASSASDAPASDIHESVAIESESAVPENTEPSNADIIFPHELEEVETDQEITFLEPENPVVPTLADAQKFLNAVSSDTNTSLTEDYQAKVKKSTKLSEELTKLANSGASDDTNAEKFNSLLTNKLKVDREIKLMTEKVHALYAGMVYESPIEDVERTKFMRENVLLLVASRPVEIEKVFTLHELPAKILTNLGIPLDIDFTTDSLGRALIDLGDGRSMLIRKDGEIILKHVNHTLRFQHNHDGHVKVYEKREDQDTEVKLGSTWLGIYNDKVGLQAKSNAERLATRFFKPSYLEDGSTLASKVKRQINQWVVAEPS